MGTNNKDEEDFNNLVDRRWIKTFLTGVAIFFVGAFLIFHNTKISSSAVLKDIIGFEPSFGITLIPMIIGVLLLFFNEKSFLGWFLVASGLIIILIAILMGAQITLKTFGTLKINILYGIEVLGLIIALKGMFGKYK